MEGRERIILLEPNVVGRTSTGQPKFGDPIHHRIFASRIDRGGPVILSEDVETKDWETRFEFRNQGLSSQSLGAKISQEWKVRDDLGIVYAVVSVRFLDRAKRKLGLFTVRQ